MFFKIGVYDNCDAADTWSWTAKGSLKYKNKWCIKPKEGGIKPGWNTKLVLDSTCDHDQNFFKFIPSMYCLLFYTNFAIITSVRFYQCWFTGLV